MRHIPHLFSFTAGTDLQETFDPLPGRHHDGGHHPGQGPGGRQLRRSQHLTLPLLQLLSDTKAHEADRERRDGDDYGRPHACKQLNELFWKISTVFFLAEIIGVLFSL